jgi:hypothetical protein
MTTITLYDDFISFCNELVELLKEDWIKFKLFIQKNKKYCLWILILLITMQFTDLLNLGASWNRYCKKNNDRHNVKHNVKHNSIQIGGDGAPAAAEAPSKPSKAEKKAEKAEKKAEKKDAKKQAKDQKKSDKEQAKDQAKTDKANAQGAAAPGDTVFSKMYKMISGSFVILSFILVVVGILSLPILMFIVITYTILKFIVKKISVL